MDELIERLRSFVVERGKIARGSDIVTACNNSALSLSDLRTLLVALEAAREDAERWRYIRRKLCLSGNGDGTCSMHAINLPCAIPGWPEPGSLAEFCDAAIDQARGKAGQEVEGG